MQLYFIGTTTNNDYGPLNDIDWFLTLEQAQKRMGELVPTDAFPSVYKLYTVNLQNVTEVPSS